MNQKNNIFLFLTWAIFILIQFNSYAENETITDISYFNNKINEVKLLNKLSESSWLQHPDSAIIFAENAKKISEKLNYKSGIAKSYLFMGFSWISKLNNDLGKSYLKKSLEICQQEKDTKLEAEIRLAIGFNYYSIGDKINALEYFKSAVEHFAEIKDIQSQVFTITRIANFYIDNSSFNTALDLLFQGLRQAEKNNNNQGMAIISNDIGVVYMRQEDYKNAHNYFRKCIQISNKTGQKDLKVASLVNLAIISKNSGKIDEALSDYFEALSIYEESGIKSKHPPIYVNIGKLYFDKQDFENAEQYYIKSKKLSQELHSQEDEMVADIYLAELYHEQKKYDEAEKLLLSSINFAKILGNSYWLHICYDYISQIYEIKGNFKAAYNYLNLYTDIKDTLMNLDKAKDMGKIEMKYEIIRREEIANSEKRILRTMVFSFGMGFVILAILAFLIYRLYNIKKKINLELTEKNDVIGKEQEKSWSLLLNILPESIANRLKSGEKTIADNFEEASVIFIDIANFTQMSTGVPPEVMVTELNNIFTLYDKISAKYGIEKIKTIGDCYMAASGIPIPRKDHAEAIACMALEIFHTVRNYKSKSDLEFQFRIGLDCGPVVAGVIGEQKFIYDLWGDAVNTASRMEETGIVGKIQCTERFRNKCDVEIIHQYLNSCPEAKSANFIERGEIQIKGKGKMKTWLLECNV